MPKIDWAQKFLLTSLGVWFLGTVANAYIPPSWFILKTWVGKHARQKKIKVKSWVTAGDGKSSPSIGFREVLVLSDGQVVKSWAMDDLDQVLFYQEKGVKELSLPAQLLMSPDWADLGRMLKDQGVPVLTGSGSVEAEQESLIRSKDSVSWVVAQKPVQGGRPQVWFEKDTFFPTRLIYSPSTDAKGCDLTFENYRRDFFFPRSVIAHGAEGAVLWTSQVVDLSPHVEPAKTPRTSVQGWTPTGNAAPSELKKLIRNYYESFR